MIFESIVLVVLALLVLVSGALAVATSWGERMRTALLLISSGLLATLFAVLGATSIALAQLLVTAGQGLVLFYFVGALDPGSEVSTPEASADKSAPSHWLLIVLGIGGGAFMASAVWFTEAALLPEFDKGERIASHTAGFAEVGRVVVADHGVTTLLAGLILLSVTVTAGFLVKGRLEE
ncbi:MAG: NADH-quinone oxidoreductase subunit J [Myxococcota bacterium]|jgi:NADH:ubiquinone oxidoreductase subunit 6 (subunit J)|nr:NADH-quinone oxidoreductase subunit J [Myxococcota bacterium]